MIIVEMGVRDIIISIVTFFLISHLSVATNTTTEKIDIVTAGTSTSNSTEKIDIVTTDSSIQNSTLPPNRFFNTAFNPDYPFVFEVPPVISYILRNETLKRNFTYNNPYHGEPVIKVGDHLYHRAVYCGLHFINKGDGYILSDKMFDASSGPERCNWAFVGSQFCTPSIECPRFAAKKGNCLTNYLQITDSGESFVLHFCDLDSKPGKTEYIARSGLLDVTFRYSDIRKRPDFECYVRCVNYQVNYTATGSSLPNNTAKLNVTVYEPPADVQDTLPSQKMDKYCKCGKSNGPTNRTRTHRIVGGRETVVSQYPWTLGIMSKFSKLPYCGGSLINDRYVLTAAHCVEDEELEEIVVALNEHDFFNDTETTGWTIRRGVSEVIPFPYYLETTFYGDMALLKLDRPVNIRTFQMTPICLPPADTELYVGTEVLAAGWGTTKGGPEGLKSPKLLEVPLVVMSNEACNDYHSHTPPEPPQVTENMLCAGYPEGGRDTCAGDSGGPVFAKMTDTERFAQVGVTSWGFGCAVKLNPGVFSRVTSFLYWIRMHTVDAEWCR